MNWFYFTASVLMFVVGIVHSTLGEVMIFRRMRQNDLITTSSGNELSEAYFRIIWSSWHVMTAFGWGMSLILLWLARNAPLNSAFIVLGYSVAGSTLLGAILIFVITKARHPGWIGLFGVAILIFYGGSI